MFGCLPTPVTGRLSRFHDLNLAKCSTQWPHAIFNNVYLYFAEFGTFYVINERSVQCSNILRRRTTSKFTICAVRSTKVFVPNCWALPTHVSDISCVRETAEQQMKGRHWGLQLLESKRV